MRDNKDMADLRDDIARLQVVQNAFSGLVTQLIEVGIAIPGEDEGQWGG